MKINTKVFGETEIDDKKIITFPKGLIGFPDLKEFALIYDIEKGKKTIQWLQSLNEPGFALPVIDPLYVCDGYNPKIDDDVLSDVAPLDDNSILVLVTVTVPHDLKKMTVNLKGPFVINADTRKGCQVIVEDDSYAVKYPIYDILQEKKKNN